MEKPIIHNDYAPKILLLCNVFMALFYISWWFFPSHVGNPMLYSLLLAGEIYHIFMAFMFWFTVWPGYLKTKKYPHHFAFVPSVDIFITVAGEPVDVVRETARAARDLNYPHHKVHILNDGYVAGIENWKDMEDLAEELGITCITRKEPGGAKAGNINNGLKYSNGKIVVVFDADMIPHKDFLEKMIPYFQNEKIGFVQSPQYYKNHSFNEVSGGAWEQQDFFFGPIMVGKEKSNATFICGTNFAITRQAIFEAGGMVEDNIAEDFLTSMKVHQKGWQSIYVSEVLAEGMAPMDLLSYFKQQLRWARGSLEVLFGQNPFFRKGLSFAQRIQYMNSALYYFNGVIVLIDSLIPIIFLLTGIEAVTTTTTSFALFFVPYMALSLFTLYLVSGKSLSFRAISFSQSSFWLQLLALKSLLLKQKATFAVTPKQAQTGNYMFLAYPHIAYIFLLTFSSGIAILREGINPSTLTNIAWGMFNVFLFIPFIKASFPIKNSLQVQLAQT